MDSQPTASMPSQSFSLRSNPIALFLALIVIVTTAPAAAFESLLNAHGQRPVSSHAGSQAGAPQSVYPRHPDWNLYHRAHNVSETLAALATACQHAVATLRVATPGDPLSAGNAGEKPQPYRAIDPTDLGALPRSAAEGLLHLTLSSFHNLGAAGIHPGHPPKVDLGFWHIHLRQRQNQQANTWDRRRDPSLVSVVATFGAEGRDLISTEIALTLAQRVCSQPHVLPPGVELTIVPLLNQDGRLIADMGRHCDTHNANDVQLDLNWPTSWGLTPSKSAGSDSSFPSAPSSPSSASASSSSTEEKATAHDKIDSDTGGQSSNEKHELNLTASVARPLLRLPRARVFPISAPQSPAPAPADAGASPLSEPETRSLNALLSYLHPTAFLSVRAGLPTLTGPGDCHKEVETTAKSSNRNRVTAERQTQLQPEAVTVRAAVAAGEGTADSKNLPPQHLKASSTLGQVFKDAAGAHPPDLTARVCAVVAQTHCPRCRVGAPARVGLPSRCGTAVDHVSSTLHVPIAATWAVYDGQGEECGPRPEECFASYNPGSQAALTRVKNNWASAIEQLCAVVGRWARVRASAGDDVALLNISLAAAAAATKRHRHEQQQESLKHDDGKSNETEVTEDKNNTEKDGSNDDENNNPAAPECEIEGSFLSGTYGANRGTKGTGGVGGRKTMLRGGVRDGGQPLFTTNGEVAWIGVLAGWGGVFAGLMLAAVWLAAARFSLQRRGTRLRSHLNHPEKSA